MKSLTQEVFQAWMESYGKASRENNPQASAELFAGNAKYYETPFDEPMIGRDAIRQYWEIGAKTSKDKESFMRFFPLKKILASPVGNQFLPTSSLANGLHWTVCSLSNLTTMINAVCFMNDGTCKQLMPILIGKNNHFVRKLRKPC